MPPVVVAPIISDAPKRIPKIAEIAHFVEARAVFDAVAVHVGARQIRATGGDLIDRAVDFSGRNAAARVRLRAA